MTKEDGLDLIVKAFGVGLLVAAITAIPTMVESVMLSNVLEQRGAPGDGQMDLPDYWSMARSTQVASGLGALARFVLYLLLAVNFLRSGSLVHRLIGRAEVRATAAGHDSPGT